MAEGLVSIYNNNTNNTFSENKEAEKQNKGETAEESGGDRERVILQVPLKGPTIGEYIDGAGDAISVNVLVLRTLLAHFCAFVVIILCAHLSDSKFYLCCFL